MTPEDTDKIVAAIDRNTEAIDSARDWLFIALLLIVFFLAIGIKLEATPLLPPLGYEIGTPPLPPSNPHLQYWHTQWVPGPQGVLPVEVFAPRLVAQVASDAVDVPEPAMFALMLTGLMAMSIYLIIDSFLEERKLKRMDARISACEMRAEVYQSALEDIAMCSTDDDSRDIARKALEGPK